ncbi:hypothetical protein [Kitasatospora sp. NPDC059599]|uniref:hypothetical protein n=1 Tax=Kitasatospora sp. NPDC059599 TaxID=3346880 RepID=UPI0036CA9B00
MKNQPATAAELSLSAAELRETASGLAAVLRATADLADAGRPVGPDLVEALSAYTDAREALRDRLAAAAAGHGWPADGSFTDLDRLLAELAEAEDDARNREARIADLRGRYEKYADLLAQEEDEIVRAHLAQARDRIAEQLTESGGEPVGEPPAAPVWESPAAPSAVPEPVLPHQRTEAGGDTPGQQPEDGAVTVTELPDSPGAASSCAPSPAVQDDGAQDDGAEARDPDAPARNTGADADAATDHDLTTSDAPEAAPEPAPTPEAVPEPAPDPVLEHDPAPAPDPEGERPPVLPWSQRAQEQLPVETLIRQGRLAEAFWFTRGSDESVLRSDTLAFAEAAFACDDESAATAVLVAFGHSAAEFRDDRTAQVAATVAALRAGLVAGWPNDLLSQGEPGAGLPEPWAQLVDAATQTVRHCRRLDPSGGWLVDSTLPGVTRELIGEEARGLLAELPRRRIGYERATQVLARLVSEGQPLGVTLGAVVAWADGEAGLPELDQVAEFFARRDAGERLIEAADALVASPMQAKESIEAKAKRALLRAITSVGDLLARARNMAASQAATRAESGTSLSPLLAAVSNEQPLPGVDGALLDLLCQWLRGEGPRSTPLVVADDSEGFPEDLREHQPDTRPLLALTALPRKADGSPDPDADGFADALLPLLARVDAEAALREHCEYGDIHLAEDLATALAQGAVPVVDGAAVRLADQARTIEAARTEWTARLRTEHATASGLLAELRTQQTLDPATAREFSGELLRLELPRPAGAYRATVSQIVALAGQLTEAVREYAVKLRADIAELDLTGRDRARFEELLANQDTVTAEEFVYLAKRGEPLPDWNTSDWGSELTEFMAGLEKPMEAARLPQGFSARPWALHYAAGDLTDGVHPALDAWEALCDSTLRSSEWQRHLQPVLRMLGLEPEQGSLAPVEDGRRRFGQVRGTVRARVSESRPGYVAPLGSAANGRYTVVIVSEEQVGRSVLDLLDEYDNGATLILYLYPMGLAGRRQLVARARAGMRQALVVDPAVLGWIAARFPRSFRATQRVTLPWTAFNPYTPFVAGLVPPEVFYGRREEMTQVVDPLGGLFLYGGRQLGKSALLRRVEASFPTAPNRQAVYIDLKARGIGEAEPAERIWYELARELQRIGVLDAKGSADAKPDVVARQIETWIMANPERRLLVLADEADAFLTADSRSARGRGGESIFPNVQALKALMELSRRRFKVVFAGLHQVQRFSHLSNVTTLHGGPDVLVGPLRTSEAQRLVAEPMAALGFVFEHPALVWRVLAATNYQASLVQIFCDQLVSALRAKPAADARWPITVTAADVRAVSASPKVHQYIAERLRITINLEDRYRVLALVMALRSLEDGHRIGYQPEQLLQEARRHWPDGFRGLTVTAVRIYLEELVGLGVLVQQPGHNPTFAVRSPNVVNMLGTRDSLELELRETEFSLPYEYNPRFSRRLLGQNSKGVQKLSPLTEEQLHTVTGQGVSAVCVTDAFGPDLVLKAVEVYAGARGITVSRTNGPDLAAHLAVRAPERTPQLVLVDMRHRGQAELDDALARLQAHTAVTRSRKKAPQAVRSAVMLVDPMGVYARTDLVGDAIRPGRWTADSLRAWPECPFDTPERRRQLVEATGGWPELVEATIHQASRTNTPLEAALTGIHTGTATPEFARRHLQRVGLDTELAELLTHWTELLDAPEEDTPARIADIIGVPEDRILDLVRRLTDLGVLDQGESGISLDPVTFRALAARA